LQKKNHPALTSPRSLHFTSFFHSSFLGLFCRLSSHDVKYSRAILLIFLSLSAPQSRFPKQTHKQLYQHNQGAVVLHGKSNRKQRTCSKLYCCQTFHNLKPNSTLTEDYLLLPQFSMPSLSFYPSAQIVLSLLEDECACSAVKRVCVFHTILLFTGRYSVILNTRT